MLYPEHDFLDRFDAAAADGFRGVEYIGPYDYPAEVIAERLRRLGLEQVLFNSPTGDWAAGDRGMACVPGRQAEFAAGIERAIAYAQALDCKQVHVMAGVLPVDVEPEMAASVLVGNLSHAAERLGRHGIVALIEPINAVDMPGYALGTLAAAEAIMACKCPLSALPVLTYQCTLRSGSRQRAFSSHADQHLGRSGAKHEHR